jgi:hypothetical protein
MGFMWVVMSPATWGLVAGLAGLAGYLPYLRDAWRRASEPDPAAWLIWTVEYSVLLMSQAAQHSPDAALWLAALQLAGTAGVLAVLAARGGGWRFGPLRWTLLGGAVGVMAGCPFIREAGTIMCLALTAEGTGMILTMAGAYRQPFRETALTWVAFALAGLLDLPALGPHAPRLLYLYPEFFMVMSGGVLIAIGLGIRAALRPARREPAVAPDQAALEVRPALEALEGHDGGGFTPPPRAALRVHQPCAPAGPLPRRERAR